MATSCINDTFSVGVYVFIIGRNSDGNRLYRNGGLSQGLRIFINSISMFDFDVGGLGSRVEAVGGGIITT